jgi:hypothetical protein
LIEDGLRLVHAKPAFAFAGDCDPLQDLAFERAAQSLGRSYAAFPAGESKVLEAFYPEHLVQLEDRDRPQAGDRLQFEQTRWKPLAHPLKRVVCLPAVQRLDAFGNCRAHAGNGLERPAANQLPERAHETAQACGGPHIGLGLIRIPSLEGGPATNFFKKLGNFGCIAFWHAILTLKPTNVPRQSY